MEKYTKDILEKVVKNTLSMRGVLLKLGLRPTGGSHTHIKRKIKAFNINTDHFLGQAINRGKDSNKMLTKEQFIERFLKVLDVTKVVNTNRIKKKLIKYELKIHICEECNNTIWNNKDIPLELHHIDGDRWNNKLENLQLLCPNCHAQTNNYCGTKVKLKKINVDRAIIGYRCQKRKVERPNFNELLKDISELGYSATGRKYKVTDNSIRKWVKMYKKHENAEVT